jgi:hypothetical protein
MKTIIQTVFMLMLAAVALTACGPDDDGCDGTHGSGPVTGDAGSGGNTGTPDAGTGGTVGFSDAGTSSRPDAGSGGNTGTPDAGTGGTTPDAGTTPTSAPAPVRSSGVCSLRFADTYIGGATCGQVRGNLPGATWSSGPAIRDTNADHELELTLTVAPAGTYELSYVSASCPGGPAVTETWANYGSRAQLLAMTADARSFVNCNWWNAATGTTVSVSSPGCNLRIAIDAMCGITGAGNMRNYR